jgi:hypothetical protein
LPVSWLHIEQAAQQFFTGPKRLKEMTDKPNPKADPNSPLVYEIRIKGRLGRQWSEWFEGMTVTSLDNGETFITCLVADQAALHGLLRKVRDLGLPLISVNYIQPHQPDSLE